MIYTPKETNEISALTLAYIGDAVFELMVREKLLEVYKINCHGLHKAATPIVSAKGQSDAVEKVLSVLTEEEMHAYLRGRNAKLPVSKKNSPLDHCRATGFEALFGYLYLTGKGERLKEIFNLIMEKP